MNDPGVLELKSTTWQMIGLVEPLEDVPLGITSLSVTTSSAIFGLRVSVASRDVEEPPCPVQGACPPSLHRRDAQ